MFTFVPSDFTPTFPFIIKFPYNAHSDWLKQRALSENKAQVDDGKLAFEF